MWVWSLCQEDPVEEGTANHSRILVWRIPWTEEPDGLQSIGSQRVEHDWSDLAHMHRYIQLSSVTQSCPTLCNPMDCSTPGLPVHHQTLVLAQTNAHLISDDIQLSHPLLSPSPPALNLSQRQGFSKESVLHIWWPKYWGFSFSISPSNEYLQLISFRMDWLDLFAIQGTFKSLLQYHSLKASILWCSAFFIVQLSHPYMTTGKPLLWLDWPLSAK